MRTKVFQHLPKGAVLKLRQCESHVVISKDHHVEISIEVFKLVRVLLYGLVSAQDGSDCMIEGLVFLGIKVTFLAAKPSH